MKNLLTTLLILVNVLITQGQSYMQYGPSEENPYGVLNPEASSQLADFAPMIGRCKCKSITRKQDGTWNEPVEMVWVFKYIMNGTAIQDETFKENGTYSGSIRQYNADSAQWYVHYYSSGSGFTGALPFWTGNREEGKIILYRDQKAPNGMDGVSRLSFYDFTEKGYNWSGEWVSKDKTITYQTWKIECAKEE